MFAMSKSSNRKVTRAMRVKKLENKIAKIEKAIALKSKEEKLRKRLSTLRK